ncbi:MAG: DUF6011 domain-containing protein [Pseudonocardiaceae bacterium]
MTSTVLPDGYYAITDPFESNRVTCWRQSERGLAVWPAKARVGPISKVAGVDQPKGSDERRRGVLALHERQRDYLAAVRNRIAEDLTDAGARFSTLHTRCCGCGKTLTDPKARFYGIGPECGAKLPDDVLAGLARRVGEMFAELEGTAGLR